MTSIVSVVKGERGLEPVFRALDYIPYQPVLEPYDTVLVKVNLITDHTYETGITTDPMVVEAVINRVHELGKKAIVVETEGGITSPDTAIHETGMMNVVERTGAEYLNMRKLEDKVELRVENPKAIDKFRRSILRDMYKEGRKIKPPPYRTKRGQSVDIVYTMSCGYSHERWKLGQRIEENEELCDLWYKIYSKPFKETQKYIKKINRYYQIDGSASWEDKSTPIFTTLDETGGIIMSNITGGNRGR